MPTRMTIQEVKITDKDYPAAIKKLTDAPRVLYYIGALAAASAPCVAVVGTRRPTDYGHQAALKISGELADAGVTVVSGLAPGIDTFAHQACVEQNKPTIAVLGTGLSETAIYPQQNVQLARHIVESGGCLISEYPPTQPGLPHQFPQRNRIVVALSMAVVVVEAKEKSGSLITARLAQEQQKKLLAVPGQIYTLNAQGPNRLIKAGATLIEGAQDVLDVLSIEPRFAAREPQNAAENSEQLAIFTALQEGNLPIDGIIKATNLPAPIIAATLAEMEISGKIRNLGGNTYGIS